MWIHWIIYFHKHVLQNVHYKTLPFWNIKLQVYEIENSDWVFKILNENKISSNKEIILKNIAMKIYNFNKFTFI